MFIPQRFYVAGSACMLFFILAFFFEAIYPVVLVMFFLLLLSALIDYFFLFTAKPPSVIRIMSDRLSNGDENKINLKIRNRMKFRVNMEIIDEVPPQFQLRDFKIIRSFRPLQQKYINYLLRPSSRGEYHFGQTRIYVSSPVGLIKRRHVAETGETVPVFPSYMQLRKYQIIAHTTMINEQGSKRMRKIGHSMEFEHIKDYVTGDDIRNVNWKATARQGLLMINNYVDEKSQQVYCIIDKGRLMKMPFNGLTLLDYAINSTLVLCNVCLQKQDKIGLITFSDKMGSIVAADRKMVQREHILQVLYRQQTAYLESDFELLYMQVRNKIKQRSLLVLYTNFESLNGLNRQMNYLRSISRHHLLLVVFFENTELTKLSQADAQNIEDVYVKTIAEKFSFEKRLIVKELQKHGILSILTSPENLTINTVNKYLELKSRRAL